MALPLEQYGLIGDCETTALVGDDGSIDWLCLPRFDSAACFAALLGSPKNGRWQLAPAEPPTSMKRQYRGDTLILETEYETATGGVTVIDFMPLRSSAPQVIRIVVGRHGTVNMRSELVVRFDYGAVVPWVRKIDHRWLMVAGPDSVVFDSDIPMKGEDLTTVGEFSVSANQQVPLVMMWFASHLDPPEKIDAAKCLQQTEAWWLEWSSIFTCEPTWEKDVLRSLITLKALTYAPTGGIVAAPTTSLPEQLGGVRNWDYRFCWLRDATFTLYSLLNAGYTEEAKAWRDWLLRAVAGDPNRLQIMYGIKGERRLPEFELPWLAGYENSQPVRIGNAASRQFQLDVYGEVLDMLFQCRRAGLPEHAAAWNFEKALLRFLETAWREPDEGIWEVRGPRRHFTHSKVMAWVAVDRAVKGIEQHGLTGPIEKWRALANEIHAEVCEQGFNKSLNGFVQYYGSDHLDASLLMLPLVGFLPSHDPRILGTTAAIEKNLLRHRLVDRYTTREAVDGLPPGEGSFLPCSFWYVDNLALQGRQQEACEMFEHLLSLRNNLGLLSEEYDPVAKRMVGNFPQAFSHVGLVNTARNLASTRGPAHQRKSE